MNIKGFLIIFNTFGTISHIRISVSITLIRLIFIKSI